MTRFLFQHLLIPGIAVLSGTLSAGVIFDWKPESSQISGQSLKAETGPTGSLAEDSVFDTDGLLEFAGKQHVEFPANEEGKVPASGFSVEAHVRIDRPQRWGTIIASMQDNGSYERGWLLGHHGDRFCFKISTGGPLVEAAASSPFSPGQWAHVIGVFDGKSVRLYVDGTLAGNVPISGTLARPDIPTPFVLGAYKDKDEFFPMHGRIRRARIHDTALKPADITKLGPTSFPFAVHPAVRFLSPTSAEVTWQSSHPGRGLVAYGTTRKLGTTLESETAGTSHRIVIPDLLPGTLYHYRIAARTPDGLVSGKIQSFDTALNEIPPDLSTEIPASSDPGLRDFAARAVKGMDRGFCLVIGLTDGALMREIARSSPLTVVGIEADPARVAALRKSLHDEGLYGRKLSITSVGNLKNLPFTSCLANLIVSERTLAGEPLTTPASEIKRILLPGGRALLAGDKPGTDFEHTRPKIDGSADWSHQYADAANTANTGDTLSGANATSEYSLQWIGRPGANFGIDRQPRMPAPLAVNGRLFHQGMNRMVALDAYNGQTLWAMEVPDLRRLNMPHDCGNWCADDNSLYVAIRDRAWALDAGSGELTTTFPLTTGQRGSHDWGFIACTDDLLFGSSVPAGAQFKDFWGNAMWFDKVGDPNSTAVICSDNVFAYDKQSAKGLWAYGRGLIVNSTITLTDDRMWFIESRPPASERPTEGRVAGMQLWLNARVVCLDTRTGNVLWDKPLPNPGIRVPAPKPGPAPEPPPAEPEAESPAPPEPEPAPQEMQTIPLLQSDRGFVQVAYGSHTGEGFLIVLSVGGTPIGGLYQYLHFNDTDGSLAWSQTTPWRTDNHGAHIAHPVVMKDRIYIEPGGVNLADGKILDHTFGPRVGCATVVGADNSLFFRGLKGCITQWSLDSRTPTAWSRVRPSCWINMLPSQGMMLIPEGGAGCSCGGWMETSIGLIPNSLLPTP